MGGPMVLAMPHQAESSMDSASRRMRATGSSPSTGSALPGDELLDLLDQDVHADAAGPAAAARLLLQQPQVRQAQLHRADVVGEKGAPPGHDALDPLHVGLLKTSQHLLGRRAVVSIGESQERLASLSFPAVGAFPPVPPLRL